MKRYIDANKYKKDLIQLGFLPALVVSVLDKQPTADVVEVRHGEWIWAFSLDGDDFFNCSVCGSQVTLNGLCARRNPSKHFPYCHCGAKMDGERSEENEG